MWGIFEVYERVLSFKWINLRHKASSPRIVFFQFHQQTCYGRKKADKNRMEGGELGEQVTESIPSPHGKGIKSYRAKSLERTCCEFPTFAVAHQGDDVAHSHDAESTLQGERVG